eukprot:SAG22_NODE_6097_length_898_cov_16.255319_1_plen_76_part_00
MKSKQQNKSTPVREQAPTEVEERIDYLLEIRTMFRDAIQAAEAMLPRCLLVLIKSALRSQQHCQPVFLQQGPGRV